MNPEVVLEGDLVPVQFGELIVASSKETGLADSLEITSDPSAPNRTVYQNVWDILLPDGTRRNLYSPRNSVDAIGCPVYIREGGSLYRLQMQMTEHG